MANPAIKILLDNATTFRERNEILSLTEAELNGVNDTMISQLYKSAINKSHIDFDDIPKSKGDITKYSGYTSMVQSIQVLNELSNKSKVKIEELDVVERALNNILGMKDLFQKGYALEKEFIMMQYCTLVASCVEATTSIISSYVDFVRNINDTEFRLINTKIYQGKLAIDNLRTFNKLYSNGEYVRVLNTVIKTGGESFVGAETIAVPVMIISAVIILVTSMREIIFYFYYSRMQVADYLETQATFLEMNKNNLRLNTNMSAGERNKIIAKQDKLAKKMLSLSDKIKVNHNITEKKVKTELNTENKGWKLDDVKSKSVSTDQTGFQLL